MTPREMIQLGETIGDLIAEATAPLLKRIQELETKLAAPLCVGERGAEIIVPGVATDWDAAAERMRAIAAEMLEPYAERSAVHELFAREASHTQNCIDAVNARLDGLPVAKDGEPGKSVTIEDVRPELERLVRSIPAAKDGEPGRTPSPEEIRVAAEAALASHLPTWERDFERRAWDLQTRLLATLPKAKDGRDGVDGFGLEDFQVEQRGDRSIVLRFVRGEIRREATLHFPVVLDAGPYRDGESYAKGDAVTFGGGLWIAQKDTTDRPQAPGSDAWRLGVRRGRDGIDGKGIKGDKGDPGKDFRPPIDHDVNIR